MIAKLTIMIEVGHVQEFKVIEIHRLEDFALADTGIYDALDDIERLRRAYAGKLTKKPEVGQ